VNVPALTAIGGLLFSVLELSVMSLEVIVALPAVLSVILKVLVPETSPALAGNPALLSEAVIPIVSVAELTTFQLASTALTVTLNGVPLFAQRRCRFCPCSFPVRLFHQLREVAVWQKRPRQR
jgi:hypothetical protein